MADLVINSLQGGLSTKSPAALLEDQCSYAVNVEFYKSKCGERKLGNEAIDYAGSAIAAYERVVWTFRHLPTADHTAAQLWALGISGSTATLVYKDTTWHTVSVSDAFTVDTVSERCVSAVSLHGKLFIAYKSSVDRLHVWDGTSFRRTGVGTPAAPTAADTGGAGAINDIRYYRVRYTVQSGGTTLRRSEPSASLSHNANATAAVTVTKPTSISEGETHWELEASEDDVLFYRIATTVVGTTTVVDSTADASDYTSGTLSEDIGDYSTIPSVRYLVADEDRLVWAGSFESATLASQVGWSPVYNDLGAGNDERYALDTDPTKDLDNLNGGGITALHGPVNGYIYAFKMEHTYQGIRTGDRANAYEFICLTKSRGAIPGTVVSGIDNSGLPSVFALDPHVGPTRMGGSGGGIETCGADLVVLWEFYKDGLLAGAVFTTQRAVYVPEKRQVFFFVTANPACFVLHTQHMRPTDEGFRGGWAVWDLQDEVYTTCLYSDNIDDSIVRSLTLRPFYGMDLAEGLIVRSDTGNTHNGELYQAGLYSKQFVLGNFMHDAEVKDFAVYGLAVEGAHFEIQIGGMKADDGELTKSASVSFEPNANEGGSFYTGSYGIRHVDALGLSEIRTLYVGMYDLPDSDTTQWVIEAIGASVVLGQKASGKR